MGELAINFIRNHLSANKTIPLTHFNPCLYSITSISDILQVISGKETKIKGNKKDPNCGFCQNHGIKILRKGK